LHELQAWATDGVRGEITVVVAGASADAVAPSARALVEAVRTQELAGLGRKDAIARVARDAGVAKRQVFDAVVAAKLAVKAPDSQ
jgi:16S rRNA (cytidine1402-2'-O)-methyltransferase